MKIIYPTPAERISAYVQGILVIENEQVVAPFALPLFANGMPTLLFTTTAGYWGENKQYLTLFGQTIVPRQLLIKENFKLIAYFLQPLALTALFGISAFELTDHPVALDLLTGKSELQDRLLNTTDTDQLLKLIDEYLYHKITKVRWEDKRLVYAIDQLSTGSNKQVLAAVRHELGLTERTLERLFEHHIGVSPKQFRRISQFSSAFRQVNLGNFRDLSAVAHYHGYADQSHFIRAFKEFTHLTPSAYLKACPDT